MHIREEIEKIVEWTKARIRWSKSEILKRLGVGRTQQSLFRRKVRRCGKRLRKINQITEDEKEKIIRYAEEHPGIGYMKLAYMMMDEEVAYVKPSSVYLVLKKAGFYAKKEVKSVAQAEFIEKPTGIHQMWHTDIAYIKILEVFYYLIVMLDGYSRYTLEWELLFDMRGDTVATFVQKVLDKYPEAKGKVKIVQDNGSCYVSYEYRTVLKHNGGIEPIYIGPYHPIIVNLSKELAFCHSCPCFRRGRPLRKQGVTC